MFKEYLTVSSVSGPLVVVEKVQDVKYAELVEVEFSDGSIRRGKVLEISEDKALVQVFEGTLGLDVLESRVRFLGRTQELAVSPDLVGRIFDGAGRPRDNGPAIIASKRVDINGNPINPSARAYPSEFIQTGVSTIDGMNPLVRGQKLPIFSGAGLPHAHLAAQIARQARVLGKEESFAVVFGAMGITFEEADFFMRDFRNTGAIERGVLFINLANDPAIERISTPRLALTAAEYLAFDLDMHVLVILIDMTFYCLDKNAEIILKDGTITSIGEFVNSYKIVTSQTNEKLYIPNSVLCWDTNEPTLSDISYIQKIPAPKTMLRLFTRSGEEFICTKDHKMLVDTLNGKEMIPAEKLRVGDRLYGASKIDIISWEPTLFELLKGKFILRLKPNYLNGIKNKLKLKFGNISSTCKQFKINYKKLIMCKGCVHTKDIEIIKGLLGLSDGEISNNIVTISTIGKDETAIAFNKLNKDMLYLMGLVASDGSIWTSKGAYRVDFSNKRPELLKVYKQKLQELFPSVKLIEFKNQDGVKIIGVNSIVMQHFFNYFIEDFRKIFRLREELIAAFLRGYFDGDGTCSRRGRIVYTVEDKIRAKRTQQLLKRIGIRSVLLKRKFHRQFIKNRKVKNADCIVFDIIISGQRDVSIFIKNIGSFHPVKAKKLKELKLRTYTKFDIVPQRARFLFREIRHKYKIGYGFLTKSGNLSKFENGKGVIAKATLENWTVKLRRVLDRESLRELETCFNDRFYLDEIIKIEEISYSEPYVYDITVPGVHNFIIGNGLISSNCESLREISAARKEIPGRRGYPGYLYTDLATLYERAGRIKDKIGSITLLPILTMPEDDKTHPIPDLTGYITEGQIILSRELHRKGIYPPVDVLPSLSRLKDKGIGKDKTREDHSDVLNQLFACYAKGKEARELAVILGEAALSDLDKLYLKFAAEFENRFVRQTEHEERSIIQTLDIGWELLRMIPRLELKRVRQEYLNKYYQK